jgi:hypothetical protein
MFDFNSEFNDHNPLMYSWLIVQIWIDSRMVQVHRQFPHLTHGNVFGAGSESDYRNCVDANSLMVHSCVGMQVTLTRVNCEDYDIVIRKLNGRTTEYSTALEYFRNRIPNYNYHP